MHRIPLYGKLMELPMFQGMSKDDLATVLGQTRFDFAQKKAGATIVRAEDECTHLYFLLNGRMEVSAQAHDNGYIFSEEIDAPYILQPENLFGISPRYTRTFVAKATCSLLLLSKSEVLRLTDDFIIFKFNLLNTISTQAQKAERLPWRHCAPNLEHRITRFITTHCIHPAGSKLVHIKMQKLANELNDNRLNVSRALNGMQKQGLIQLKRGCIVIPMLEKLVAEWG